MIPIDTLIRILKARRDIGRAIGLLLLFALIGQGCSGFKPLPQPTHQSRRQMDVRFFEELEAAVTDSGVNEASTFPVKGFPYLRTTRFLASMKERVNDDNKAGSWVAEMHRLGLEAGKKEINNLPERALIKLAEKNGWPSDRGVLTTKMVDTAARMKIHDRSDPEFLRRVKEAVYVPEEYSTPMRIFGLYALAAIPVSVVARNANLGFSAWHQILLENLPVEGKVISIGPENGPRHPEKDLERIFSPLRRNELGLPKLDDEDIYTLAQTFAPVIAQDVVSDYDRFGIIEWQNNQVHVNPLRATVYYYTTYSLIGKNPVVQINYAFWYSERTGKKSPAIEKGPLDGITVRVSLNPAGQPVMVDVMNTCGCYHFYAPRKGMVTIKKPNTQLLYPFVATWLPVEYPERRLTLRINSGWHQVERLYSAGATSGSQSYQLVPYDVLESLPHTDGRLESVFDPDGIMKNSWRIEPYILFSMGIPRIGYMRQRSHHAIHIVGRAHFTDPDIFNRYFDIR